MLAARELVAELATTSVTPVLRPAGFAKRGLNYHRRAGELVHVINLQLSHGNFADQGTFYINVGIDLNAVRQLEQRPAQDRPKPHECVLQWQLEQLIDGVPAEWRFGSEQEGRLLAGPLRVAVERLLVMLDRAESAEAVLELDVLTVGTFLGRRAQLHHLVGDDDAAIESMRQEVAWFRDRPNWNVERRLDELGLGVLGDRVLR